MLTGILEEQLQAANAANAALIATNAQLNVTNAQLSATNTQLNATIAGLQQTVKELRDTVSNLETLLTKRDVDLDKAQAQMRSLKALYGPKQSEKSKPDPEPAATPKTEEEKKAEAEKKAAVRKARGNNGARRKDYFAIETKEEDIYPEGIGAGDGEEIHVRDVIRYEMVPPRFIKHIHHVHVMKVGDTVMTGIAPLTPLLNSRFDGSFIAGISELRYLYSMPVERIVKYFKQHGFEIDKKTAHGLLAKTAGLFDKLYEALKKAIKEGSYLNCDETYHTILVDADENDGKGSKKGYIWVIVCAETGLVYFFYDDGSRSEKVILNELKGYNGIIQSDGLGAYKKLAILSEGRIVRLSCLQHCKRAFLEKDIKDIPDAKDVADLANKLYQKEHMHRIGVDGWTVEDNLKWRQKYAPPILAKLKSKLEKIRDNKKYPPKSLMHKAATYFLNEWDGIEAISHYGNVDWDNDRIERINRYISLSRHNSLFFGSHAGARRGCIFYSLACSCRCLGINFFEYISDVLNKSAAMPPGATAEAYRNLLPDKWVK